MRSISPAARIAWWSLSVPTALLLAAGVVGAGDPAPAKPADKQPPPKAGPEPLTFAARFADNRTVKATLREERLELTTPYGKLVIPAADIHRIEFSTRIEEEEAKRIEAAVANLGSTDFKVRENATAELVKLKGKSLPGLLHAAKSSDAEVVRRAQNLLEKLRDELPEDLLEVREFDVIHTAHSKIAGRITGMTVRASTASSSEVEWKVADLRSLRSLRVKHEDDNRDVLPDPGNMTNYGTQVGKTFRFKVTGAAAGNVWGTDVYTTDSTLAVAAVHAGAVRVGQTATVKVKIVPPPPSFAGTTWNGVSTGSWGPYPSAYQVIKVVEVEEEGK